MEMLELNNNFWTKKRVFVTGHTGFKGGWLCSWLKLLGAQVCGYALNPDTKPSFFETTLVSHGMDSVIGDIRDSINLEGAINNFQPEIFFHLAAQPLVRESYKNPKETYETNVIGTLNLLEAARQNPYTRSIVVVTTDKVYENHEWEWPYRENDRLGGHDPYSNSKACTELLTSSYELSFFNPNDYLKHNIAIGTARAGNVIGGGDWSSERLIPDIINSIEKNQDILLRNPTAIRPWQHVLDPLSGYLILAKALYLNGPKFNGAWNFGPHPDGAITVEELTKYLLNIFASDSKIKYEATRQPHEAHFLKLDISKSCSRLNWTPRLDLKNSLTYIKEWELARLNNLNMNHFTLEQINKFSKIKKTE